MWKTEPHNNYTSVLMGSLSPSLSLPLSLSLSLSLSHKGAVYTELNEQNCPHNMALRHVIEKYLVISPALLILVHTIENHAF